MRAKFVLGWIAVLPLAACVQTGVPALEPWIVSVYATPSVQVWLNEAFNCNLPGIVIRLADSPAQADISIRLGEPDLVTAPVYQIDTEEILIVTNWQSPLQNLTVEEARALFAGDGDPSLQVWVFARGEDIQIVFERAVMAGRSVTSLARLAVSPQQMSDTLVNTPNTVGFLPRHWKVGDARSVYTIPDVPVLALVKAEPQGAVRDILACLQK